MTPQEGETMAVSMKGGKNCPDGSFTVEKALGL